MATDTLRERGEKKKRQNLWLTVGYTGLRQKLKLFQTLFCL